MLSIDTQWYFESKASDKRVHIRFSIFLCIEMVKEMVNSKFVLWTDLYLCFFLFFFFMETKPRPLLWYSSSKIKWSGLHNKATQTHQKRRMGSAIRIRLRAYAESEDPDQSAHSRSLIRAFPVHKKNRWKLQNVWKESKGASDTLSLRRMIFIRTFGQDIFRLTRPIWNNAWFSGFSWQHLFMPLDYKTFFMLNSAEADLKICPIINLNLLMIAKSCRT